MKQFNRGDIVPGCEWTIERETDDEILEHVGEQCHPARSRNRPR
jgi:predicted small metal-binding protein